jgi:hypothetical protein
MITSQQLVLASAVSQMAGVLSDDGQQVTLFSPSEFLGSKLNSSSFIARNPDSSVYTFQNEQDAIARLAELQDNALALDFWLLLLDADVKVGTKKSIAAELELMFERESCLLHVQNILCAAPIPKSADTQFITGAELGKRVRDFADMLIHCQGRIKTLHAAWIGMREDAMVKAVGHERLTGVLIRTSVFRRLVSEVTSQSELEAIRGTILMD